MNEYEYIIVPDMSGICITSVKSSENNVIIPSVIDKLDVVEIGENAFYGNCHIECIEIPSSVKKIRQGAFHGIYALKTVIFSDGLKELGDCDRKGFGVFLGCDSLKKIEFPDSLEVIGDKCFSGCENLTQISFGKNLVKIGAYAFERTSIQRLILPPKLRLIGEGAFLDSRLKEIQLNNGLISIGAEAFAGCRLKSLNITPSVEFIGDRFCSSLYGRSNFRPSPKYGKSVLVTAENHPQIVIEDDCILSSDKKKIIQAMNKTELNIPDCVKVICRGVLESSEYIEKICIPKTVKTIENRAFFGINTIKTLTVAESLRDIGKEAFVLNGRDFGQKYHDELALEHLVITKEKDDSLRCHVLYPGKCIHSNVYGKEFANTLANGEDGTFFDGHLYDETLRKVKHSSFKMKASLIRLMYPYKLSDNNRKAHMDYLVQHKKEAICYMIDEDDMELLNVICNNIKLTDDVVSNCISYAEEKSNGEAAAMLLHANSLTYDKDNDIVELDDLFSIDFFADYDSDETIETNWELEECEDHVRILRFKSSDKSVNVPLMYHNKPIVEIGDSAFLNSDIEVVKAFDNIEKLGNGVWSGCKNLKKIELSKKLKELPDNLFYECVSLEEIKIHEGIEYIGEKSFYKCHALKSIKLPQSCVSIGHSAFGDCSNLNNVIISSVPQCMGEMIFRNCVKLTKIDLPDELKLIPEWIFAGCRALQTLQLPKQLLKIDNHAFFNCVNLKKITFPETLCYVGSRAFSGCRTLTQVEIYGNKDNIHYGEWVFSGCKEINKIL